MGNFYCIPDSHISMNQFLSSRSRSFYLLLLQYHMVLVKTALYMSRCLVGQVVPATPMFVLLFQSRLGISCMLTFPYEFVKSVNQVSWKTLVSFYLNWHNYIELLCIYNYTYIHIWGDSTSLQGKSSHL